MRSVLAAVAWLVAWPLLMLALGVMLAGCSGIAGPIQIGFGQSDALSCSGKSEAIYGATTRVKCDGVLRWTTGGALSEQAVSGIEAAARGAAKGAAGAVVP